jgi:hypothetical protein
MSEAEHAKGSRPKDVFKKYFMGMEKIPLRQTVPRAAGLLDTLPQLPGSPRGLLRKGSAAVRSPPQIPQLINPQSGA